VEHAQLHHVPPPGALPKYVVYRCTPLAQMNDLFITLDMCVNVVCSQAAFAGLSAPSFIFSGVAGLSDLVLYCTGLPYPVFAVTLTLPP